MNRPDRSAVVGVAVVVAGCLVSVREVFTCHPPRDQADMIELFEADPLVAAAPDEASSLTSIPTPTPATRGYRAGEAQLVRASPR